MNVTDHTHNTFSSGFQHDILTMGLMYSVHDTMHAVVRNEHTTVFRAQRSVKLSKKLSVNNAASAFTLAITEACE